MTRVINCEDCKTYLGEIRDANLRTDIKYYCSPCSEKKQVKSHFVDDLLAGKQPDTNFMNDLFKNVRRRND